MNSFEKHLKGGDLRSIGKSNEIVKMVNTQNQFDELFQNLFHPDRRVVMRAADAIEKITLENPAYLKSHKNELVSLFAKAKEKELKWHLALLAPRNDFTRNELKKTWEILSSWATNMEESKIVRVNSIQALYHLSERDVSLRGELYLVVAQIKKENIPSLNARIKKLNL